MVYWLCQHEPLEVLMDPKDRPPEDKPPFAPDPSFDPVESRWCEAGSDEGSEEDPNSPTA